MHNAPSVSYPVGRCAFQRQLYLAFTVLTSAVLWIWALEQECSAAWWTAAIAAGFGGVMGGVALGQVGELTWDGQVWCLHARGHGLEEALGNVHVALDVQKALLLRWQPTSDTLHAQPRWLWLGLQDKQSQQWHALRCAVYQSRE